MQQQQMNAQKPQMAVPKAKKDNSGRLVKVVIALVVILQVGIFGMLAYGMFYRQPSLGDEILTEVREVAGVSDSLVPLDIVELDDTLLEDLKGQNDIQDEVYKDAQSGDYVVIFNDRMIIYRRDSRTVVYEGDSPAQIAQNNQLAVVNAIIEKAKDQRIIDSSSEETPQVSQVTDPQKLIEQNADFYARAEEGDLIAVFPQSKKIILYNPNNQSIYKTGNVDTVITSEE